MPRRSYSYLFKKSAGTGTKRKLSSSLFGEQTSEKAIVYKDPTTGELVRSTETIPSKSVIITKPKTVSAIAEVPVEKPPTGQQQRYEDLARRTIAQTEIVVNDLRNDINLLTELKKMKVGGMVFFNTLAKPKAKSSFVRLKQGLNDLVYLKTGANLNEREQKDAAMNMLPALNDKSEDFIDRLNIISDEARGFTREGRKLTSDKMGFQAEDGGIKRTPRIREYRTEADVPSDLPKGTKIRVGGILAIWE